MTHLTLTDDQESLATAYALGMLEPAETESFARHLADDACEACRRHVDAMAEVCGDLAVAPAPVAPSPAVRERLLDAIGAEARRSRLPAAALTFTFAGEGDWIELKPGVFTKDLIAPRQGDASRSYLVRMEPGTVLDRHGHECFEHCYVISGSTMVHGRRMQAGDYSYAPRGTVHEPIPSEEGALLFIVEA